MTNPAEQSLYKTETKLKRSARVSYPWGNGYMVLRTEKEKNNGYQR
jgi:hypothetical protein